MFFINFLNSKIQSLKRIVSNYSFYSNFFKWFSIVLILIGIISFILTLLSAPIIFDFDFTNQGLKEFYNRNQYIVLIFAASITTSSLWITFEKMSQSEIQLKFNNFYTHREEFIKTFIENYFIKGIASANEIEPRALLVEIYSIIYYRTYENFNPVINNKLKVEIIKYYDLVSSSPLNKNIFDIGTLNQLQITHIRQKFPSELLIFIYRFSQKIQKNLVSNYELQASVLDSADQLNIINSFNFIMLHDIFYSIKLMNLLLTYDDFKREPLHYLTENIFRYRHLLHLPFDIYSEF